MKTLRPYQVAAKAAFEAWEGEKYPIFHLPTGTGKSFLAASVAADYVARGERVLWLTHRHKLAVDAIETLKETCGDVVGAVGRDVGQNYGAQVVVAKKDTIRQGDRLASCLAHGRFGLCIVDECFPAGTLVDGRPIESVSVGDSVTAYCHASKELVQREVLHKFAKWCDRGLVKIQHQYGVLVCTREHPVWVEGRGYVESAKVEEGDMLRLRDGVREPYAASVLQQGLCVRSKVQVDHRDQQEVCLRADEEEQSHASARCPGAGVRNIARDRSCTKGEGREWKAPNRCRVLRKGSSGRGLGASVRPEHGEASEQWVPNTLQDRRCEPCPDASHRGGWLKPHSSLEAGPGPEEGCVLGVSRVERVEVEERGSDGGQWVYNLEVDSDHNYFANGVLVHNCHHWPAASFRGTTDQLGDCDMLGLTATPDRADKRRLSDHWQICFSYPVVQAFEDGAILRPYLAVDKCPNLDLSRVNSGRTDYVQAELQHELMRAHIVEHTLSALTRAHEARPLPFGEDVHTLDPRTAGGVLVYCVGIDQAEATAEGLREAGWSCAVLHSKLPTRDQDRILQDFEDGRLQAVVNCGILTEGTDLPPAQVCVIARPTMSWSLYVQMVGRVTRPYRDYPNCWVLDLVGCSKHHSIVSAPALIDGVDCSESSDGKHHYILLETGEGRCMHCGHTVVCGIHGGGHVFKNGKCECGATQCEHSPNHTHHFIPWDGGIRMCVYCGLEVADPLGALAGRIAPPDIPMRVEKLRQYDAWACDLGEVGILILMRHGELRRPYWYQRKPEALHPLSPGPVEQPHAKLLMQDVARRAEKVRGKYGGKRKLVEVKAGMRLATNVIRRYELWSTK